ncbi:hypothetical protein QUB46_14045 [Microcoleus sp. A6-D1]
MFLEGTYVEGTYVEGNFHTVQLLIKYQCARLYLYPLFLPILLSVCDRQQLAMSFSKF